MMIGIQEGLGLDILVHEEPERTDMVKFFGQQMEGMAFTTMAGCKALTPGVFVLQSSGPIFLVPPV